MLRREILKLKSGLLNKKKVQTSTQLSTIATAVRSTSISNRTMIRANPREFSNSLNLMLWEDSSIKMSMIEESKRPIRLWKKTSFRPEMLKWLNNICRIMSCNLKLIISRGNNCRSNIKCSRIRCSK